ncbi:mitotic spindle assembly checkpoint protein MAD2A-like isoform X2 [Contarinia nasturtii]|uniref:mitotic spindle assembly checkpoint protein MAD2A-like isoform X2 n=1 Tax=Contarinia nasturtii TaxID=265458 RepID=UPI0012D3A30B|nr:mitotic spindle assembly checkpoint protein MAD2A-like isoform X2 [Contarinia nasturtii]
MATAVRSKSITITASAGIVIDYIDCALNTILYLRGIYPASQYKTIQKYGLSIQMSTDPEVQHYLKNNLSQIKKWIIKDEFIRLCLVIKDAEGTEVENYEFRVQKKDDPNNRKEKRTIDAEIGLQDPKFSIAI